MLAIAFLLVCGLFGTMATTLLPVSLRLEERVWMGVPVGLAVGGLLSFAVALLGAEQAAGPVTVGLLTLATIALLGSSGRRRTLWESIREMPGRLKRPSAILGLVIYLTWAAVLTVILAHAIFVKDGTLYAGFANVWGDWNQHLAQTTSFAYGHNLPPGQPVMSGQRLTYPFLTNWVSAILVKGGLDLVLAMVLLSIILAWSAVGMIMTFTRVVAGRGAALLTPFLFFLGGGLGFINFFNDLWKSHQSLGTFLAHMPHSYTQSLHDVPIANLNWINPIFAYVVPQRAFLFGLPILLMILWLLFVALRDRRRSLMLAAGVTAVLLPLVHAHALIFLGFITPLLFLRTRRLTGPSWREAARFWVPFVVPILLIGLPQLLWLTAGLSTTKFFRLQLGWISGTDNIVWFWLKNIGVFLPLLVVALFAYRRRFRLATELTWSAGLVFVLANIFVFQPWDWDNTKLFVYWYVTSLPLVALVLVRLFQSRWRVGAAVVGFSMVLAGAGDVAKTLQWSSYQLPMFNAADYELARYVQDHTEPGSVFLTGQEANNPISGLAGRPIILGYTGWLWSYGLDYEERQVDVGRMMEATEDTPELLKTYGIDYVVIGPNERAGQGYSANETYYRQHYALWHRFGDESIYDIKQPLLSSG